MIVTKKTAMGIAAQLMDYHLCQADEAGYRWFNGTAEADGVKIDLSVVVMTAEDLRLFDAVKKSGLQISFGEPEPAAEVAPVEVEPATTDDTAVTPEDPEPAGEA